MQKLGTFNTIDTVKGIEEDNSLMLKAKNLINWEPRVTGPHYKLNPR